jgi:hypothetical protein
MKFKFDVECTPEEARQFIGLPNVAGMQDRVMKEIEAKMQENLRNLDPETFVKTWLPVTVQGWNEMQKMFWGQMGMNPMADAERKKAK